MITLETMMTKPWWRARRTRPGETILICKFAWSIFWSNLFARTLFSDNDEWLHAYHPLSIFFFSDIVFPWSNAADHQIHRRKENHQQKETPIEQRPPLRKGNRDFIDNALFWTRSSSHRCWDLKLNGAIHRSLYDLVVSIDEKDIRLFFNSLDISLKTENTSYNVLMKNGKHTPTRNTDGHWKSCIKDATYRLVNYLQADT